MTRCVRIASSIAQIDNHYSVTWSLCRCRAARAAKKSCFPTNAIMFSIKILVSGGSSSDGQGVDLERNTKTQA